MKNQSFNPETITKLGYVKVSEHTWEVQRDPERDSMHARYKSKFAELNKLSAQQLRDLRHACLSIKKYCVSYKSWESAMERERDKFLKIIGDHVVLDISRDRYYFVDKFDMACLEAVCYARQIEAQKQEAGKPTLYNTTYGRKDIKTGATDLSNLKREVTHIQTAFDALRPELERKNPKFVGKSRAKVAKELYHRQEVEVDGKLEAELGCTTHLDDDYSVSKVTIEYQVCGYPAKVIGWTEILYGLSDKILDLCKKTQPKNTVSLFDGL